MVTPRPGDGGGAPATHSCLNETVLHLEKRIPVTGGVGFLGSHLCERLLERGADLVCVDNFFTGAKRNIAHLINAKPFELVRHHVTFPLFVEVDEIYNLACPA